MAEPITITFEMTIKQEALPTFEQIKLEMLKGAEEFDGFRSMAMVRHKDNPARVLLIEKWDSEDAYKSYIAWRTERGDMEGLVQMVDSMDGNIWPDFVGETRSKA